MARSNSFFSNHLHAKLILGIVLCIFLLVQCVSNTNKPVVALQPSAQFQKFAGSTVCGNCHKDVYDKHRHTEHHLTSSPVSQNNILGSFIAPANIFRFDRSTELRMERSDSEFFQVEYLNSSEVKRVKFDIVVGSGRKGQSYLNWEGNRLAQLPITYFSPDSQWSNSPGYPPYRVVFNRPITSRCLECHTTYVEKTSDPSQHIEEFDRSRIVYGIECEKCHGPGADHVAFETTHPGTTEAKYIVNPGKLPRERLLDFCSLCHGGRLQKTQPSFQFQAGDTLANYFSLQQAQVDASNIDVHGNQMGLLSLSKCFTVGKVTCINCHNVHQNEKDQTAVFSQRCLSCHSTGHEPTCRLTKQIGPSISQNCIDCHMPKQLSHAVAVFLQGAHVPTAALMRTHFIKVYPDETEKMLKLIKQANHPIRNSEK